MRNLIIATFLLASATPAAIAQTVPQRPTEAAPAATAAFEQREAWCQKYAAWFVERTPSVAPQTTDLRPTQRIETEIGYCKLDPREYERQTLAEIAQANVAS